MGGDDTRRYAVLLFAFTLLISSRLASTVPPPVADTRALLAWAVSCAAQTAEVHEAARTGDLAKLKVLMSASPGLVNAKDEDGGTPLHTAAMAGRTEAVLLLLQQGAQADARNTLNQSPLLYAAYGGYAAIVDTLIARGSPSDYQDTRGNAPIHYAARQGHTAVVKLLVSNGVSFDTRGYQGRTLLQLAAMNGHADVVKLLAARFKLPMVFSFVSSLRALYFNVCVSASRSGASSASWSL